jgi:extradiol dioxygenase family protein
MLHAAKVGVLHASFEAPNDAKERRFYGDRSKFGTGRSSSRCVHYSNLLRQASYAE